MVPPGGFSPHYRPEVPQDDGHNSPDQRLSSRIESFSDIAEMEFGGYYYGEACCPITSSPPSSPSLRGRESLVSLPTQRSNSTLGIARLETRSWFATTEENAYQHIRGSTLPDLGQNTSMRSVDSIQHAAEDILMAQAVPEDRESMHIALIPAAAPIHGVGPSASSPEYTDLEMSKWQEQEKAGRLSNGLGVGLKPETTIREADLMSSDRQVASPRLSRSMSLTGQKPLLSRSATRKALGQDTADRTGQAVQVIIEDPESEEEEDYALHHRDSTAGSSFTNRDAVHSEELADLKNVRTKSTGLRPRVQRTETFYPHPDWKPFSMRWPYLTMLIFLSIALAGLTEALYQSSARKPLVSFNTPQEIKPGVYFVIKFLPTIVAVTYGVLWQVTDFEVRRLEAFHQLSKEGGATAAETLNVDYITNLSFLRPLHAFRLCHYAVTVSSVASLLAVSAVPTLTSACIILTPDRKERTQHPEGTKNILVDPTWSRVLEVVLLLIALMGGVLFAQLRSRRSGLLADVKGIAGLAAMANVSHILMDFKDTDVATHKDIHQKLAHNRYILRNSSLAPLPAGENGPSTAREDDHGASGSRRSSVEHKFHLSLNPHPLMLRAAGCVPFITGILLFAALLPILLFTPAGYLTDKAPWVVTALAVCIKLAWGAVDTNVRMIEPFFILYKRHAPPKTLTLDYTAMPFAWVALKALLNRHWLVFAVGFGTIMTEVLTVLVTSLATVEGKEFARMIRDHRGGMSDGGGDIRGGQETAGSFWISFGLATFILLYMGAVATVVFVRRRKPFLPRQPNTIASVLAFIHQSKMLWSFVGTEKLGNREILQFLDEVGQTYGLGWFEGRDGREHCGIDQEELKTSYRHGLDYSRSNKPWVETFSEWL
ncbi:hypothetical protein J7T55_009380 [Diaporthe amygdali]|uniref:uncharacterized protein n=1 Tax=Phomopsis amygdali TaxID=1214568 RepID=UPI0022FEFD79|nr:uncharacterized protein J7T55_009380 [Diaporthe amygdali]KAJ0107415.1 hypothetical protein J7T55_009380 [Diaporthe amygdali]